MVALLAGLIGGILHVVAGPDHLASIAPLAAESRKSGSNIGLKWGIGHTISIILIGSVLVIFRKVIPLEDISFYSERFAGIILIALGIWGLQKVFFQRFRIYEHTHNNFTHIHFYRNKNIHSHTAFLIGIVHGLAGSSHIYGVIPALLMPGQTDSLVYLAGFGAGTICSMTLFSGVIGKLSERFSGSYLFYKTILAGCSFSALTIGCIWLML